MTIPNIRSWSTLTYRPDHKIYHLSPEARRVDGWWLCGTGLSWRVSRAISGGQGETTGFVWFFAGPSKRKGPSEPIHQFSGAKIFVEGNPCGGTSRRFPLQSVSCDFLRCCMEEAVGEALPEFFFLTSMGLPLASRCHISIIQLLTNNKMNSSPVNLEWIRPPWRVMNKYVTWRPFMQLLDFVGGLDWPFSLIWFTIPLGRNSGCLTLSNHWVVSSQLRRVPPKPERVHRSIQNNGYIYLSEFFWGDNHTWRIIPASNKSVTPIYKQFRPLGRGTTLLRGLTNHGY